MILQVLVNASTRYQELFIWQVEGLPPKLLRILADSYRYLEARDDTRPQQRHLVFISARFVAVIPRRSG